MIHSANETPRYWMTLDDCSNIFKKFFHLLDFGEPLPPFESRFVGILEGILGSVQATYNGKYLNQTILDAATAYFNQFIRGHAFKNGNKRLAVLYTHMFLLAHGYDFDLTYQEMYSFAVAIAQAGEKGVKAGESKHLCHEIMSQHIRKKKNVQWILRWDL